MNPYSVKFKLKKLLTDIEVLLQDEDFNSLQKFNEFRKLYNELSADLGIDATNLELLLSKLHEYIERR